MRVAKAMICGAVLAGTPATGETLDFTGLASDRCALIGLAAPAPDGWISIAMQDMPPQLAGCQMLRLEDEMLLGIMRLISARAADSVAVGQARDGLVALEREIWAEMGLEIGPTLWQRDHVAVSGEGFSDGAAIGLAARIVETDLPQEIHLLMFRRADTHYALSVITPAGDDAAAHYRANLDGFRQLLGTLAVPATAQ
jgi:hypothetical protein